MYISELPVMIDAFTTHRSLIALAAITVALVITAFVTMFRLSNGGVLLVTATAIVAMTLTMAQSQAVCDEMRADALNEWLHETYGLEQTLSESDVRSVGGSNETLTIREDGQALELITINGDKLALVDSGGHEVPTVDDQR